VFLLNSIPKTGQDYSPRDLVFGEQKLNYDIVCKIPFGAYAKVHDDLKITNTMQSLTTGAISLGATGNAQGTYRFFNLHTGELIVRRRWTELPIPQEAITRLQDITYAELDPNAKDGIEDEDDYYDDKQRESEIEQDDTNLPEAPESDKQAETEQVEVEKQLEINKNEILQTNEMQDRDTRDPEIEIGNTTNDDEEEQRYNLRPNRTRDYAHKFTFLSVRAGLKKWGDKARAAVLDELLMFLQLKVFAHLKRPSEEQIQKALRIHCFLTEKHDGRVKARAVADGQSQVRYMEE